MNRGQQGGPRFDRPTRRAHLSSMTQRPEIRIVVLDTTQPCARLAVENWPRAKALAFHGLPDTKKPRQRVLTGAGPARRERL